MKTCTKCNTQFPDDTAFCTKCGATLSESSASMMLCPICKNQCAVGDNFCQKCGFRFRGAAPVPPTPNPTNEITLQQYCESYADPELKKNISSIFWALLALGIINLIFEIFINGAFPLTGLVLLGAAFWWKNSPGMPCALLVTGFSSISTIIGLVQNGHFGGWLTILAGIYMIVYVRKLTEAHTNFLAGRR